MDKNLIKTIKTEQKKAKVPGIIRGVFPQKKWDKKVARHIYLPEDREFFASLTAANEEGSHRWMDWEKIAALEKKERKRLKSLSKVIKANRKGIRMSLVLVVAVLAAAAAAFQLHFKDVLLTQALQQGLERTFGARCDLEGVHLSLGDSRLEIGSLVVADKASPMSNLFEASQVIAQIDLAPLFQGRLLIDELQVRDIKRNTPRSVSGALPERVDAKDSGDGGDSSGFADGEGAPAEEKDSAAAALDRLAALAGDLDVKGLLEKEKDKLKSLALAEESRRELEEEAAAWQAKMEKTKADLNDWGNQMAGLSRINPQGITTLAEAQRVYGQVDSAVKATQRNYQTVKSSANEVQESWKKWQGRGDELMKAAREDGEYLEGLVKAPGGEKAAWVTGYLEEQLAAPLTKYYGWYQQGRHWFGRFKELQKSGTSEEAPRPQSSQGRDLPLDPPSGPRIALGRVAVNGEEPSLNYAFEVKNLVTDPSQWDAPFSLEGTLGIEGAAAALQVTESGGSGTLAALPVSLENSLSALGLGDFTVSLSLDAQVEAVEEDTLSGKASLVLDQLRWTSLKDDEITRLLENVLRDAQPLPIEAQWEMTGSQITSLQVTTNLQEVLARQMGALLQEKAAMASEKLQEEWGKLYQDHLAEYQDEFDQARTYYDQAVSYADQADSYEQMVETKKAELEARIEALKQEAENKVKEKAGDAIQQGLNSLGGGLPW